MPIFFLLVGILLIVVSINDKIPELGGLIKEDFQPAGSQPGFGVWIVAIFVIGSLGYIREFKPVANSFLALVVIVMLLSNRGFFDKFSSSIKGIG